MSQCTIYVIRNTVNESVYVGQTSRSLNDRMREHRYKATGEKRNSVLYTAMREIGVENFHIESLEIVPKEHADEREKFYIRQFQSDQRGHGYNLKLGTKIVLPNGIIEMYSNGRTLSNIAELYGVDRSVVARQLRELGIDMRDWNKEQTNSALTKEVLDDLYNSRNMTAKEIGSMFGLSDTAILNWLKKYDIPRKKAVKRKEVVL